MEKAGRALEPAWRASEPAGRVSEPAGRDPEPDGKPGGRGRWTENENENRENSPVWWYHRSSSPTGPQPKGSFFRNLIYHLY